MNCKINAQPLFPAVRLIFSIVSSYRVALGGDFCSRTKTENTENAQCISEYRIDKLNDDLEVFAPEDGLPRHSVSSVSSVIKVRGLQTDILSNSTDRIQAVKYKEVISKQKIKIT